MTTYEPGFPPASGGIRKFQWSRLAPFDKSLLRHLLSIVAGYCSYFGSNSRESPRASFRTLRNFARKTYAFAEQSATPPSRDGKNLLFLPSFNGQPNSSNPTAVNLSFQPGDQLKIAYNENDFLSNQEIARLHL